MISHLPSFASALHTTVHTGLLAGTATTKAPTKSSSSSIIPFLLILILGGGYFYMRSKRNRVRAQQTQGREIEVGDEVTTNSGIIGRVHSLSDDRVELEVAPGTVITVVRQAVGRHLSVPVTTEEEAAEDEDHDGPALPTEPDAIAHRPTELPDLHAPDEHQRHEHPEEETGGGLAATGGTS